MNCFEHRTESAVGVCRQCGRALCAACAEGSGRRVLCASPCRDEAAAETARLQKVHQVTEDFRQSREAERGRRDRVVKASARSYGAAAIAGVVLSAAGIVGGVLAEKSVRELLFIVAGVFAVVTVVRFVQARSWLRVLRDSPPAPPTDS